jgi:hypothetical protein
MSKRLLLIASMLNSVYMYSVCLCVLFICFCACVSQKLSSYKQISIKRTAIGRDIRVTTVNIALLRNNVMNVSISDTNVSSLSFPLLPTHSRYRVCLFSLDRTQTHNTVGTTPLEEGSARRRDLT